MFYSFLTGAVLMAALGVALIGVARADTAPPFNSQVGETSGYLHLARAAAPKNAPAPT